MEDEDTQALTPKLRFPEFGATTSWDTQRLGEVVRFFSGGTPSKDEPKYWNGSIPWISASSMYDMKIADSKLKVTPLAIGNGTRLAPKGSLLVLVRGSMLFNRVPMGIAEIDVAFNQDVKALAVSDGLNGKFLLYQLLALSQCIPVNETGIGAGKIETGTLTNLHVYLPPAPEQQKITDCLTSLDELIAAQGRKVAAQKAHKKGLMQQLFPREGETVPRLRFPEFQGAGEWEEVYLASICRIQRGKFSHRPRNDPKFFNGPYAFIQTGDVVRSNGGAVSASQSLNELGLSVSKLFQPTIVLITIAANIGDTGILESEACFTDSVVGLIPKDSCVIARFLESVVRFKKEYLNEVATTGAQKNINNEILSALMVLVPSIDEQQRIADCLSSLDAQIAAETEKLNVLKTHKKGLMQQLFPSEE